MGRFGIGEAGAGAAHGVGHGDDRLVLADDALAQALLHLDELLDLGLEQPGDGDARPLGDDLGDVLLVDLLLQHAAVLLHLGEPRVLGLEALVELHQGAVAQLGGLLEIAAPLGVGHGGAGGLELLLDLADRQDGGLLRLPLRLEMRGLLLQLGELGVELGRAAPATRRRTRGPRRRARSRAA